MNKNKTSLSVIILAKNEATRIVKAISSVDGDGWEVLVIDQASTDETVKLAAKAGARVLSSQETSFSKLRDLGRKSATSEWIFYLDADEQMTVQLTAEIKQIIKLQPDSQQSTAYFVRRQNYYLGHKWPVTDQMQRLFWAPALTGWQGELHESPVVVGETGVLTNHLLHDTHRNLSEMVDKTNSWSEIEADLRLKAGHPPVVWWRFLRVMITGFWRSYFGESGLKVGTVGLIESMYQAFSMFITYAKLWERQQKNNAK